MKKVITYGTYDYFVFPAEECSQSEAMNLFVEVTRYTTKNNNDYPYTAYEYQGTQYCGDLYGKQYYEVLYSGLFGADNVPFIP